MPNLPHWPLRGSGLLTLPLTLSLCWCASAPLVRAADLWLEPLSYRSPSAERRIGVQARFGDLRASRVEERRLERLEGLWVQGPRGWAEVAGEAGDDPLGLAPIRGEGAHLLALRGRAGSGRLAPEGWRRLFAESGRDPADAPGEVSEVRYVRYAKALILAGAAGVRGQPWAKPLGLELELLLLAAPHDSPSSSAGGIEGLPLQLVAGGRPLAGVPLRAWCLDVDPLREGAELPALVTATTDAEGIARLDLPRRGRWVVCATALAPGDLTRWEAAFTSLSFSADPAPPVRGPAALALALSEARERDLLRPLLGVHHFRFDRRYFGPAGEEQGADHTLMTYTLELDESAPGPPTPGEAEPEEGPVLRVAVDVSSQGRAHAVVFEYAIDVTSGRLRWLRNQSGDFRPEAGRLALPAGEVEVDEELLLPKVVGVFLIPQLAAALPPGSLPSALRLIDLTPFATLSRALLLRPARPGEADFDPQATTWVTEEGRAARTTRVRVAHSGPFRGKLIEIQTRSEVDAGGQLRMLNDCARLSPEDYRAQFQAWFGSE